ncbi:DNA repair protein RecN [Puteibacter caeruleilacunae]|nr:DNA repair protein RecN [Puteibacter caeruleilacunae]
MLSSLEIRNYALIKALKINFHEGFSIITGETGAGKSILLGALSLILGNRADSAALKDNDKKCFVEGVFDVTRYGLKSFFEQNDLDYDEQVILRREISPAGKSRAFINDTPVNLSVLRSLGVQLIDIHSQHQNLELSDHFFQLKVLDVVASHKTLLDDYCKGYKHWIDLKIKLQKVKDQAAQAKSDLDYHQFQLKQLEEAQLEGTVQEDLEQEMETLNHAEDIKAGLVEAYNMLGESELNVLNMLKDAGNSLRKLADYNKDIQQLSERLESNYYELQDVVSEIGSLGESLEYDPQRLAIVRERLDLIYDLQQKHRVATVEELLVIENDLREKVECVTGYDDEIASLEKELEAQREVIFVKAEKLSENRMKCVENIQQNVEEMLGHLGMPNAHFKVDLERLEQLGPQGIDRANFLFSANKNATLHEISKVASGGEISRLMLAVKAQLTSSKTLPTIIFDEIDTGISGDVADKMGGILKKMSKGMQVINITHLPQVAAKGDYHYFVYKKDNEDSTQSSIRHLEREERINELAKMLSGEKVTEAALTNARELLN